MSLRWSGWSLGLTISGLLLVAFALIWIFVIFPIMAKMPADYEQEYVFDGSVQVLDTSTMSLNEIPTRAARLLTATDTEDNVLLLRQDISFFHAQSGTPLGELGLDLDSSELYGLDRSTRENVFGYGDTNRSGQFTFPAGVKKESYDYWSSSAMSTLPAQYISEEQFKGLTVYNFKIEQQGIDYGTNPQTGAPQTMDVLAEIKVEPVSGIPIYAVTTTTINMPNPLITGEMMPVLINSMHYSSETIDELSNTAESTRSLILWASVYGFWIVIGLGAALILGGVVVAVRSD
ncbi:MAG: DUF3068 domain-containing protein [Dehalococcoidia bacterium]|nr:MAG: DUF3068 domain-containing protein [Dehalococcoidia bacterium]